MRILAVHNYYLLPGGEDQVYQAEIGLLRSRGNEVYEYAVSNDRIATMNRVSLGIHTIWSLQSFRHIKSLLQRIKPDLVHFHNIFPLLSPSVYYSCHSEAVPVVQTLHNYRNICASALLLRDGKPCQDCLYKAVPWPGIFHACYRNSYLASASVSAMLINHKILNTWKRRIDCYIALTNFARQLFLSCGFPDEKIAIKPNFVSIDPGVKRSAGSFGLFIGRLSPEKGVHTLARAWNNLSIIPLQIVGDGPEHGKLVNYIGLHGMKNIVLTGHLGREKVVGILKNSRFLILPSLYYEGFPLVLAESFSCGTPVIASRLGAMAEIVEDGKTGLLFTPGDAEDLAEKVEWAWNHPAEMAEMGKAARREYEEKYTAERNYQMLMEIYQKAIENHQRRQ